MHRYKFHTLAFLVVLALAGGESLLGAVVGFFEGETDIGVTLPGGARERSPGIYEIQGGGANMWFTQDAFHFVWKRLSGDLTLGAEISFVGQGGNAHRKACLLIRQNLEADSAYADVALHGDGLTSLQFREIRGAKTQEIQFNVSHPKAVRLEKQGKYVSVSIVASNEALHPSGASARIMFRDPFYVGLGVCSHDSNVVEKAVFSRVELKAGPADYGPVRLVSTLETVPLSSRDRRVVYVTTNLIEAPNWSRDGAALLFNSRGRIYKIKTEGGDLQEVDTGFANR